MATTIPYIPENITGDTFVDAQSMFLMNYIISNRKLRKILDALSIVFFFLFSIGEVDSLSIISRVFISLKFESKIKMFGSISKYFFIVELPSLVLSISNPFSFARNWQLAEFRFTSVSAIRILTI